MLPIVIRNNLDKKYLDSYCLFGATFANIRVERTVRSTSQPVYEGMASYDVSNFGVQNTDAKIRTTVFLYHYARQVFERLFPLLSALVHAGKVTDELQGGIVRNNGRHLVMSSCTSIKAQCLPK